MKGLEPPRLAAPDPKSGVATNYTTSALLFCDANIGLFFAHSQIKSRKNELFFSFFLQYVENQGLLSGLLVVVFDTFNSCFDDCVDALQSVSFFDIDFYIGYDAKLGVHFLRIVDRRGREADAPANR